MSFECVIEFRQNGPALDVDVEAIPLNLAERVSRQVLRPRLQLSEADMDQLRRGNPPQPLVAGLAANVSGWLLNPDLDLALILRLATNPQSPWRVVFSMEKVMDERLRQELAELPFELLEPPGFGIPLVLNHNITSVVHQLPKMGNPPAPGGMGSWPFRVLIVRSNPADLGGAVPPAAPLRDAIRALRNDLASSVGMQIDVLSSEAAPGLAGRPTRDGLVRQIPGPYDVLVYLGHGDLRPNPTGGPSLGVLLLETEDGQHAQEIDAQQLSILLNIHPVPVVLLVGCLTAAEIPEVIRPEVEAIVPQWIRGSQGVAQALINGMSGVHFVVGMRCRVENSDALLFLNAFFERLLKGENAADLRNAGNLEAALREARVRLKVLGTQPMINWAAPVAFRTRGQEPTFPYLASRPPATVVQLDSERQQFRSRFWQMLADINWTLRAATGVDARLRQTLDTIEQDALNQLVGQGSLLIAARKEIDPNALAAAQETEVEVTVSLRGPLQVESLAGAVVCSGGSARLLAVEAPPELEAAGFECLAAAPRDNRVRFRLAADGGAANVPEGLLFKVKVALPRETPSVYVVDLEGLRSHPPRAVGAISNAVIVPSP